MRESRRVSYLSVKAGATLLLLLICVAPAFSAPPQVWVVSSLERVRPDTPAESDTNIELYAAKGEYESFQIIVTAPAGGLTGVNVIAEDLQGPAAAVIPVDNVTLYREHYVYVSHVGDYGINRSEGPGWYPDGLIPFVDPTTGNDLTGAELDAVPFDLAAGQNQPIWIDVFVPRTVTSGHYAATFTVTSDQGESTVSLALTVWDMVLPLRPSLKSSIGITGDYQVRGEELLRHRLMPRPVALSDEADFIDHYGLSTVNLGFWSGADLHTCAMSPPPSAGSVATAKAQHDSRLDMYAYIADEIGGCAGLDETIKAYARSLHASDVDCLITMAPRPSLYDDDSGSGRSAVDIWVVLPKMYDGAPSEVAFVLDKGDEVWSYNDLNQDDYSPKWLLDFAPINYRIQPGFVNQSLGLTGILYWRADLWTADPWNDVNGYSSAYPGEGMLLYPGAEVGVSGVCPSMRLKWLRDGVEDYELIQLLKDGGWPEFALGMAAQVGTDWTNWTRDPAVLETARRQLGDSYGRVFYDVGGDHWAFAAIMAAYNAGIVGGYPDGSYQPDWDLSRSQMAVFIARSLVTPTGEAGVEAYDPPATPTFWDVPTHFWSYPHIELLHELGVVGGYPDGAYRPNKDVTRDQMAVYIARGIADPIGEDGLVGYAPPAESSFSDVAVDHWARRYIEYVAEEEVVFGYPDGFYRPQRRVTRDQMAVFISRAFHLM
ncbi:MAG: S-layer homology domain-containing protein [Armatimonadetes bacterium]|nr:S-layer homology domain-containing protein [Armatimonadota bacterium]